MLVARIVGADAGIGSSVGRIVWAQRAQDRPGRPGTAGHGALDGRGVAVVAADVEAAAEVDRAAQLQRGERGRLHLRRGDGGEVCELGRGDPMGGRDSARTSRSSVGTSVELATSARPSGL